MFYRVRNFEKYQHYKDRRPAWIKLHAQLLDDYEFSHLPDATKFHAVAIWLLASQMDNRIPGDAVWLAKKIGASEPVDFQALVDAQLLEPCEQRASKKKAPRKQTAMPERETETDKETETEGERPTGLDPLAWSRWETYRAAIKKPIRDASVEAAQKSLAAFGADQMAVVEQSIANGWQGLFALKNGGTDGKGRKGAYQRVLEANGLGGAIEGTATRIK